MLFSVQLMSLESVHISTTAIALGFKRKLLPNISPRTCLISLDTIVQCVLLRFWTNVFLVCCKLHDVPVDRNFTRA